MASTTSDNAFPASRAQRKRDGNEIKRFTCANEGCGRSFTRAEHLQRHVLNHSSGQYTCERCRAHFKRSDLLERHIARHRQKDEEAGAEGCGVLATRKRMWKDADGNIVMKKPKLADNTEAHSSEPRPYHQDPLPSMANLVSFPAQCSEAAISPPTSNDPSLTISWDGHEPKLGEDYPQSASNPNPLSTSNSHSTRSDYFWSPGLFQQPPDAFQPAASNDTLFDDIFNPDTASSFNNPFTTMSNYNWLFDIELAQANVIQQPALQDPSLAYTVNKDQDLHPQPDQINIDRACFTSKPFESSVLLQADIQRQTQSSFPPRSPSRNKQSLTKDQISALSINRSLENTRSLKPMFARLPTEDFPIEIEQPMSMLQSRSLPIIDELAQQQLLDLIDIMQPTGPDGNTVMRAHPMLALTCLQTYCDLFFTRFNTAYPLIHMSTFDPSKADVLLLIAVLLLGATYADKDAHQLAVCIHDVLRPQIFADASFSAKPDLWVLQTILLVECFGKSRAGQKQHDLSHLFHGLLINLIRRSDCQSIRSPTLEDATEDLENDWQSWCHAEQKKRLAFLCFMWDTQHAVLFCQSLCMSAFELRSDLPCNQSIWEAESAESWNELREKQPTAPLFLSCLKMYLLPNSVRFSKHLNALSRSLVLHGLLSVAWDLERRDKTSLGVIDNNPLGNWQSRLARSYNAWYNDYTFFCASYLSRLPSSNHPLAREFHISSTANIVLYHAAHILLHTPFLDLQIYAGARHILGRAISRTDYTRSQKVMKKWFSENVIEAGKAMWHAAALVTDSVDNLDDELSARLWHHPWTVYLGTLVIWGGWHAWPYMGGSDGQDDEIIWDPTGESKALLNAILKNEPGKLLWEGSIEWGLGKRGTNGLAVVVSRRLSKVRWAVVHDAMMVLKGLVQWRLIVNSTI